MKTLDLDDRQSYAFLMWVLGVGVGTMVITGVQAYLSGDLIEPAIVFGLMSSLLTYIVLKEYFKETGEVPLA